VSVSPEDLGRGLFAPDLTELDAAPAAVGAPRARRSRARTGVVAAVALASTSVAAAAGAATGVLPADRIGEAVSSATSTVTGAVSRSRPTPAPTAGRTAVAVPTASVDVLLDAAERHLGQGRLQPASSTLTAALARLESVPVDARDAAEVERYGVLRARLLAALETGAAPGRPSARPTHAQAGPTDHPAEPRKSRQPSRDASAKPRA
jgi:hypothetical protein